MICISFVLIFFVHLPHNQEIRNIMVPKILLYFCSMKDPRIERKKLHPLDNIIFITIAAVLCGAETWKEIENLDMYKKTGYQAS